MSGFDIIPDGSPIEEPELSADTAYQGIPATAAQALGTQAGSTVQQLGRVTEQGQFEGSGWLPQFLYGAVRSIASGAEAEGGQSGWPTDQLPGAGSTPSPTLTPQEYNSRYAPIGNDGKPVSLGDQPMPDGVAKLVGEAKRQEIERDNVLSRYEGAHSWPTNFATNTLGFMLDPLRAATAFVPGIGEEAIVARLGGGVLATIAGRLAAGAATGAAAQAPLSALQYTLGQQEASDYGLRDAFRDLAFGAAGNAILHAGIAGPIGDLLRSRRATAPIEPPAPGTDLALPGPPAPEPTGSPSGEAPNTFRTTVDIDGERTIVEGPARTPSSDIRNADAQTQHAAMSSAIAEMADGRPIDVEPFFDARSWGEQLRDASAARAARTESNVMWRPDAEAEEIAQREGIPTAGLTEYEFFEAYARRIDEQTIGGQIPFFEIPANEVAFREAQVRLGLDTGSVSARARATAPIDLTPNDVAQNQAQLYRDGFEPTVPDADLRQATADIYEPAQANEAGVMGAAAPEPTEPQVVDKPEGQATEAGATDKPVDPELAAAQARIEQIRDTLLPEEQEALAMAQDGVKAAEAKSAAFDEAANCLKDSGI